MTPFNREAWMRSRRWPCKKPEEPSIYAYAFRIINRQFYEKHCLGVGKPKPCPYYDHVRMEDEDTVRMTCKNRTYTVILKDREKNRQEIHRELEEAYKCPNMLQA